ncbi:MAG: CapA family protein, partial [Ruminococcus sp.]|nr:CapA family protein [Ruminococcus sp.]
MKKILCLILSALTVSMLLTSCGSDTDSTKTTKSTTAKSTAKQNDSEPQSADDDVISFVGVGDNLIHTTIYEEADRFAGDENDGTYDFTPMYSEVKNLIDGNDIAFINQETIVGGYDLGLSGYPVFNSPSEVVENVKSVGFNLANMATNHSLDMGQEGVDNALETFRNVGGIDFAGVADSDEEYDKITVFEKKGVKFAFLAYTANTNGIDAPNPYTIHYFDEDEITNDVKRAKEISDVVIVSAHWGDENLDEPTDFQEYYAQFFADLGVDVVIGTHPHVIEPIKWFEGENGNKTLVTYSLGNFLGGMLAVNNIVSGMVSFDFVKSDGGISVENVKWTPFVIHFELDGDDIMEDRCNYKVYPLSEYTDELAEKHA